MMAGAGVAGFAGAAGWVADGSGVDPGVRLVVGEGAPGGGGGETSGSIFLNALLVCLGRSSRTHFGTLFEQPLFVSSRN